jgi:hypothetical protein
MKHTLTILMFWLVCMLAEAQQTHVIPWNPMTNDVVARARVYHPNPILFVHGINTNDEDWGNDAIPALTNFFGVYDLPNAAQRLADPTDTNNLARYPSKQQKGFSTRSTTAIRRRLMATAKLFSETEGSGVNSPGAVAQIAVRAQKSEVGTHFLLPEKSAIR